MSQTQAKNVLDLILPTIGNHRPKGLPIWEEERQMFLMDQRESKSHHLSYKGVRVTDRFMTVETIGHYHTLTYINALELYVYDGQELKLAGKKTFDKLFYDKNVIREEFQVLFEQYLRSQLQLLNMPLPDSDIREKAMLMVNSSYCHMTDDNSKNMLLLAAPMLSADDTEDDYIEC